MLETVDSPGHPSVLVLSRCSSAFGLSQGGVDVLARRHASALARNGFSVCLVASFELPLPGAGRTVRVAHTQFLLSQPRSRRMVSLLFLLNEFVNGVRGTLCALRILRKSRFDLVVSNHSVSTLILKMVHPSQLTTHYVHDGLHAHRHVRGLTAKVVRYFLNDVLEFAAAGLADRIFCVSEGLRDQLVEVGIPASKISIVGPVLGDSPMQTAAGSTVSADPELLAPEPYILTVGQQSGRKRFDLLIQAMEFVPRNISLVIVGDGPLHDSYVDQARLGGLQNRIRFLQGVSDLELSKLYSHAEVFALVSENEGHPVTVAEALSLGRKVVLASPSLTSWSTLDRAGVVAISHMPTPKELGDQLTSMLSGDDRNSGEQPILSAETRDAPARENALIGLYSELVTRTPA